MKKLITKDNVKRLIGSLALLMFFAVIALFASYNIHYILNGEMSKKSKNFIIILKGLEVPQIRSFFFLFMLVAVITVLYILLTSHYIKYKSDIQKITPDIETPKAEGQGQYGSARWLRKKDIEKTFGVAKFDINNKEVQRLIDSGYDDLT